jgi:hypothetical protein
MAEDVKFDQGELDTINKIQETYLELQQKLGQVSLTRVKIEQQIETLNDHEEALLTKFKETQTEEKSLVDAITEKYGDGTLDPTNGIFTPNKDQ